MELPCERPLVVVGAVAVEGPGQRPLLPFGAQVGVDAERLALGRGGADPGDHPGRRLLRHVEVGRSRPVVDEEDVDVGGVGQFPAPQPAHADHGEGHRRDQFPQRRLHRGVGQVGQLPADLLHLGEPEEVAGGDAEQFPPLEPAQAFAPFLDAGPPGQRSGRLLHQLVAILRPGEELVVLQGRDELRMAPQGVPHQPARAEQPADPLGGARRFPEGDGQRTGPGPALGQPAELEQAHVGIGGFRQPFEEQGKELPHQLGTSGQAGGELGQGGPGLGHVAEAEGGQPLLGRLLGQRAGAGDGFQQRAEEQLLVDGAHLRLLAPMGGLELFEGGGRAGVPVAEDPGQVGPAGGVGRQGVDLGLVDKLEAVLHGAEEAVGGVEGADLRGVDVAGLAELVERLERVGGADAGVVAGVDELEQLHGELDVPQASPALLDLPIGQAPLRHLLLGPGLHHPDLADGIGVEPLRPHVRVRRLLEGLRQVVVASYRAGLDERLELPVRGPLLPVDAVGVEAARQGAGPALGAEVGVGPEDDAVGRRRGHGRHEAAGDPLGGGAVPFVDEEDVDVARVVQLPPAELPHADDGDADVIVGAGPGQAERRLEAALGQRRQLPAHRRQIGQPQQVPHGDAEELLALPAAQSPSGVVGVVLDRPAGLARVAIVGAFGRQAVGIVERRQEPDVGDDRLRQRAGGVGERNQGRDEEPVVGQPVGQLRMGVEQPGQGQAGLTGLGGPVDDLGHLRRLEDGEGGGHGSGECPT